jgi:small subunit ribosomal protein S11
MSRHGKKQKIMNYTRKKVGTYKRKQKRKQKPGAKKCSLGIASITTTRNNCIISLADIDGNVKLWESPGKNGIRGRKKRTPYACGITGTKLMQQGKTAPFNCKQLIIHCFGRGKRHLQKAALKGMNQRGIEFLKIRHVGKVPHNGCRPPCRRRVKTRK